MALQLAKKLSIALIATLFALGACGDDANKPEGSDAGGEPGPEGDAGIAGPSDAGDRDCFERPETYLQIINACTEAERVEKDPELPQRLPDGSLPPLP